MPEGASLRLSNSHPNHSKWSRVYLVFPLGQPAVQAEIQDTLGSTYYDLGDYLKAEAMHLQALAIRKSIYGSAHTNVAMSLTKVGAALQRQGKLTDAETRFR